MWRKLALLCFDHHLVKIVWRFCRNLNMAVSFTCFDYGNQLRDKYSSKIHHLKPHDLNQIYLFDLMENTMKVPPNLHSNFWLSSSSWDYRLLVNFSWFLPHQTSDKLWYWIFLFLHYLRNHISKHSIQHYYRSSCFQNLCNISNLGVKWRPTNCICNSIPSSYWWAFSYEPKLVPSSHFWKTPKQESLLSVSFYRCSKKWRSKTSSYWQLDTCQLSTFRTFILHPKTD